ncbi:hypothetical protein HW115_05345 [Verrucomicrobiaceae bacterium N1E253]|uniref:Glycosyl hydrolase family 43 n=1 Tax=Oceaniferula marina TaxID=2748318 RepID=A0A851GBP2_9BACT|nr:glycoside hydrolase family protein [Oceaniferula marina]NWK55023.1 hypothetical protein [Oceaniferula marina]
MKPIKLLTLALTLTLGTAHADDSSFADHLEWVGVAVQQNGYHVWGSSPIIGEDGKTHLFCARWPISSKFDPGWRDTSEIAHYTADSPEGPFTFSDLAIKGTGKATWDKRGYHNPVIKKVGERYVLLFIANDGSNPHPASQRIGMATSKSLNGPWKKVGKDGMILAPSTDPNHWTHKARNGVNNPAFIAHPDGKFYLFYKSNKSKMGLAIADKLEGPYLHNPKPVTDNKVGIEDGYAFLMDGKVRLLTTDNHGILRKGGGILWTSDDGQTFNQKEKGFHLPRHYWPADFQYSPKRYYGPAEPKFERPQVLVIDGKPAYVYLPSGSSFIGSDGTCSYVLKVKPSP